MSIEFLITSLIVVLLPAVGVIYTLAIGLGRGFRAASVAAFGCTMGIIPSIFTSVVGLAALLHANAVLPARLPCLVGVLQFRSNS